MWNLLQASNVAIPFVEVLRKSLQGLAAAWAAVSLEDDAHKALANEVGS